MASVALLGLRAVQSKRVTFVDASVSPTNNAALQNDLKNEVMFLSADGQNFYTASRNHRSQLLLDLFLSFFSYSSA